MNEVVGSNINFTSNMRTYKGKANVFSKLEHKYDAYEKVLISPIF